RKRALDLPLQGVGGAGRTRARRAVVVGCVLCAGVTAEVVGQVDQRVVTSIATASAGSARVELPLDPLAQPADLLRAPARQLNAESISCCHRHNLFHIFRRIALLRSMRSRRPERERLRIKGSPGRMDSRPSHPERTGRKSLRAGYAPRAFAPR